MKITIILGNGFDIKIGLNTRYTDYYVSFLAKYARGSIRRYFGGEHSVLVQMMQKRHHENWSDLEQIFGETVKEFPSISAIKREKQFLEQSINDYLVDEQNRVTVCGESYKDLKVQLDTMLMQMLRIGGMAESELSPHSVEVVTFNYTDVVDRIFENANRVKEGLFCYSPVKHIHGRTGDVLILGVDNWTQYDYRLPGDVELLDTIMIKPELNNSLRRGIVENIVESIEKADVIVIYGSSIGYTDSTWWRIISEWMKNDESHKVLIFGHVGDATPVSATAQLGLSEYIKHFLEYSDHKGNNNIEVHKCEDWMFSFDESIIRVN